VATLGLGKGYEGENLGFKHSWRLVVVKISGLKALFAAQDQANWYHMACYRAALCLLGIWKMLWIVLK